MTRKIAIIVKISGVITQTPIKQADDCYFFLT